MTDSEGRLAFGAWLREVRLAAGFSQKRLGDQIDFDQSRVSNMERGKPEQLTILQLIDVADLTRTTDEQWLKLLQPAASFPPTSSIGAAARACLLAGPVMAPALWQQARKEKMNRSVAAEVAA